MHRLPRLNSRCRASPIGVTHRPNFAAKGAARALSSKACRSGSASQIMMTRNSSSSLVMPSCTRTQHLTHNNSRNLLVRSPKTLSFVTQKFSPSRTSPFHTNLMNNNNNNNNIKNNINSRHNSVVGSLTKKVHVPLLSQTIPQPLFFAQKALQLRAFHNSHYLSQTTAATPPAPPAAPKTATASKSSSDESSALATNDRVFYNPAEVFAVVHIGASQYKVVPGDVVMTQKMEAPVASEIYLQKVLLCGGKNFTLIGTPLLDNVRVLAQVEEQTLAQKVLIYKKKRRKNYRRQKGHRQQITMLKIKDIEISSQPLTPAVADNATPEEQK